jgi:4-hydroxy-2-oxoglutarate aldolase
MTCLENGGKGGVVSAANYFPDDCARIASLFTNGDVQAAKQLHEELVALIQQTGGAQGIASLKACMALMGYDAGAPRLPVLPLGEKQIDDMKHRLHSAGKL